LNTTAAQNSSVAGSPYPISVVAGTLIADNYNFLFVDGQLTITAAPSSILVNSSANSVPTGSNVTFTATVSAVAPGSGVPNGSVQFKADGFSMDGLPVSTMAWLRYQRLLYPTAFTLSPLIMLEMAIFLAARTSLR
jgi:hypothetical protein